MAQIPETNDPIVLNIWGALEKQREQQLPRNYLGMSSIGKPCARQLWFQFRGYSPLSIEGRSLAIFELGDDIEVLLKKYLTVAGYGVSDEQLAFDDFGGLFRGHCDGVIEGITHRRHILECKSANKNHFNAFRQAGLRATWPEYYCQVQCYMGYAGMDRALVVAYCKDNSDIHTERVYFKLDDFYGLRARALQILSAAMAPEPYYKDGARECEWCGFHVVCRRSQSHLQRLTNCGTCQQFALCADAIGGQEILTPTCTTHGVIPRDFWARSGCERWQFNDGTVPF